MGQSYAEENYLKAILKLSAPPDYTVNTNAVAAHLNTTAASVTDMLKKLGAKGLVEYRKYQGASLTDAGARIATYLVRKHRLWEVFLVEKLGMAWDEVHDIAEELEHIQSDALIERLDAFLGHPRFDPHGDPIPNAQGRYTLRPQVALHELTIGQSGTVVGVRQDHTDFLKHLTEKGVLIGKALRLVGRDDYDQSLRVVVDDREILLSGQTAQLILIKPIP